MTRPMILLTVCGALTMAVSAGSPVQEELARSSPLADEVMSALDFDAYTRQCLLRGDIVNHQLADASDSEVAVTVAMLVPAPVSAVAETISSGEIFEVLRDVVAHGEITSEDGGVEFAEFDFGTYGSSETAKLLRLEPGGVFNLSSGEIARLQAAGGGRAGRAASDSRDVQGEMTEAYRAILGERYRAYRAGGVAAIAPYDRGDTVESAPGAELAGAAKQMKLLARKLPEFNRAIVEYPAGGAGDVVQRFFWMNQRVQSRPTAVLLHRMSRTSEDGAVFVQRSFFVGHGYNARHVVVGCFPVESGSIVFHASRTFADRVGGPGSRTMRRVGRDWVRTRVTEYFRVIRDKLEKRSGG